MEKLSRLLSSGLSAARSLAVAVLFVVAAAVSAQTVSISPKTGNVISAVSYDKKTMFKIMVACGFTTSCLSRFSLQIRMR